jgi:superfamily I DNA/RNA helicase
MVTADKKYASEYLKILQSDNFSADNHGRILWVFKALKLGIEIPIILKKIDIDQDCINDMLDCLSVYEDSRFLPIFEKYLNHNDSYTRGIAKKAIKKIKNKIKLY